MICKCGISMVLRFEGVEDGKNVVGFTCSVCGRVYKKLGESESWSGPSKVLNAEMASGNPGDLLVEG
jgi:hypothetical protein